jgi:hypothetical protein
MLIIGSLNRCFLALRTIFRNCFNNDTIRLLWFLVTFFNRADFLFISWLQACADTRWIVTSVFRHSYRGNYVTWTDGKRCSQKCQCCGFSAQLDSILWVSCGKYLAFADRGNFRFFRRAICGPFHRAPNSTWTRVRLIFALSCHPLVRPGHSLCSMGSTEKPVLEACCCINIQCFKKLLLCICVNCVQVWENDNCIIIKHGFRIRVYNSSAQFDILVWKLESN